VRRLNSRYRVVALMMLDEKAMDFSSPWGLQETMRMERLADIRKTQPVMASWLSLRFRLLAGYRRSKNGRSLPDGEENVFQTKPSK
jgi:hypothetical protein